jgi:hypothetical protein
LLLLFSAHLHTSAGRCELGLTGLGGATLLSSLFSACLCVDHQRVGVSLEGQSLPVLGCDAAIIAVATAIVVVATAVVVVIATVVVVATTIVVIATTIVPVATAFVSVAATVVVAIISR